MAGFGTRRKEIRSVHHRHQLRFCCSTGLSCSTGTSFVIPVQSLLLSQIPYILGAPDSAS
eukprot:scaffold8459_cov267-Pinguiococcus_pyrenoidosus.AAC.3